MLQKKNLLHIVLSLEIGGLEMFVKKFITGLAGEYNQSVLCLDKKGIWGHEIEAGGKEVFLIRRKQNGTDWFLPFKIASLLKRKNVDIIHTHNFTPNFYGVISAKLAGVPVVINTQHNSRFFPCKTLRRLGFKATSMLTSKIACVSQTAQKSLVNLGRINSSKIEIIINGIDCNELSPSPNRQVLAKLIPEPEKDKIIGIVGRLSPEKDHKTLLKAFAIIQNKLTNVKLIIVGDGNTKQDLEKTVKEMQLDKKVFFLGARTDVRLLLNSFDLFVLSSITEGVSLALLEAMACGLPVVATNVGGNSEIVQDGESGIIVPAQNHRKLSDAILEILSSKQVAAKMGQVGRKRVLEKFSMTSMLKNYRTLYENSLEKSKSRWK